MTQTKDNIINYLDNLDKTKDKSNWKNLQNDYSVLNNLALTSKIANLIIPLLFICSGITFIFLQFSVEITDFVSRSLNYISTGTVSPVTDNYENKTKYISKPSGLDVLTKNALNQHILITDTASEKYSGIFYFSAPSIGINRLPVQANVDSTSENSYGPVLNKALAHFKGTSLPISDVQNNIVIYGHSASPLYNPQKSDPQVAFSFLNELKVGDDIVIEIDGKTYKFIMSKGKIVEPTDVEIITGTPGKRTLTIFTCWPQGNDTSRYVIIARPA